jgi:IS5 family transposase
MKAFDWQLQKKGYIPMSEQIVDASLVPAPKQRNSQGEREAIKSGLSASEIGPTTKTRQRKRMPTHAGRSRSAGKSGIARMGRHYSMIALPVFGYKSHISIDRRFGFIRGMAVTSASAADGRLLRQVVSMGNTSSEVWADSAYRSKSNEQWLSDRMMTSRIHRRKPMGKPMPRATARANAAKSSIRAHVEHVFAHQKNRFGLFIRTIGLARAEAKLTLCNLAYNFNRLIFHERRESMA